MFDEKISRRSFLTGGTKVAAALFVAPAIIKIDHLMKIQVVKTMEEAEEIIQAHNFTIDGLQKGSSVMLMDAATGEHLVVESNIQSTRKSWEIPARIAGGSELKVLVRKSGFNQISQIAGAPYPGGKTKIVMWQPQDLVYS